MRKMVFVPAAAAMAMLGMSGALASTAAAAAAGVFLHAADGGADGVGTGGADDPGDKGSGSSVLTIKDDPVQQQEQVPGEGSETLEGTEGAANGTGE